MFEGWAEMINLYVEIICPLVTRFVTHTRFVNEVLCAALLAKEEGIGRHAIRVMGFYMELIDIAINFMMRQGRLNRCVRGVLLLRFMVLLSFVV